MKKLFAIALVSVFLLHFAGVYTYFGVRLMAIRQEMKQLLKTTPDDQLEVIQLTKSEYEKSLHEEDELELKGRMYDIARVEVRDGIYYIYALHDESEDSLLSFLDEVVKRSTNDKKPVPSVVAQFLALVFVLPQSFEFLHPLTPSFLITEYTKTSEDFDLIIDVPPPQG